MAPLNPDGVAVNSSHILSPRGFAAFLGRENVAMFRL
jgi:hypothetical protein